MSIAEERIEKFAEALITEEHKHTNWKPDCQGKADFDYPVLHVSTRSYSDNSAYSTLYIGNAALVPILELKVENQNLMGAPSAQRDIEQRLKEATKAFYVALLKLGDPELIEKEMTKAGI